MLSLGLDPDKVLVDASFFNNELPPELTYESDTSKLRSTTFKY